MFPFQFVTKISMLLLAVVDAFQKQKILVSKQTFKVGKLFGMKTLCVVYSNQYELQFVKG